MYRPVPFCKGLCLWNDKCHTTCTLSLFISSELLSHSDKLASVFSELLTPKKVRRSHVLVLFSVSPSCPDKLDNRIGDQHDRLFENL